MATDADLGKRCRFSNGHKWTEDILRGIILVDGEKRYLASGTTAFRKCEVFREN